MPKTQDALAMRTIARFFEKFINSDSKLNEDIYILLQSHNDRRFSNSDLARARTAFQFSSTMIRRLNCLIKRIQKHVFRLEKLLGKIGYNNEEKVLKIRKMQTNYLLKCTELDELLKKYQLDKDVSLTFYRKIFDEEFGKRLQEARKKAGMTQVQIAQELNISQNAYSQYERGLREPPFFLIWEFSSMFGVSIEYFFRQSDI